MKALHWKNEGERKQGNRPLEDKLKWRGEKRNPTQRSTSTAVNKKNKKISCLKTFWLNLHTDYRYSSSYFKCFSLYPYFQGPMIGQTVQNYHTYLWTHITTIKSSSLVLREKKLHLWVAKLAVQIFAHARQIWTKFHKRHAIL